MAENLQLLSNIQDEINKHTEAANALWDVREGYKSLLVDFDVLSDDEIRKERNKLTDTVSHINKSYPGTDKKSFAKAWKEIGKYTFEDGEAKNC